MSTTISMWLGIAFLALAVIAVFLQAWLWGPKFWNEELKKTEAPRAWLRVHAFAGYAYGIIYVVMMWNMLPRLWEYQYELPARTVFHAVVGITIGVLLICKVMILLFFRHFEESMPYYGFGLLLCTVILSTLSIPYAVQAHDFSGRTTDPENVERVQKLLAKVDWGEQAVDIETITTKSGFERGRQVLVKQCIVCHDMRTILAKPRTPQKWFDVSVRMLDKPSVFGEQLLAEDIPPVTAYLAAITPEIQKSTKEQRKLARERLENTDAMVALAHAAQATPSPAKIDPATGEALLQEHCTACHELDENDNHGPDDLAGWRSVVAAMVDEGAEYDDDTATQIAMFLAQKYPAEKEALPPMPEAKPEPEPEPEPEPKPANPEPEAAPQPEPEPEPEATSEPEAETEPKPKAKKPKPKAKPRPKKPKAHVASDTPKEPAKPPPPKADAKNGRALYMAKCKTCHGASGKGDSAFGRKLGVQPLSGLGKSKIKSAVVKGVPGTKMKAYRGKLTPQEIDDIVAFVRRL